MGVDRTLSATTQENGPPVNDVSARCVRRDPLCRDDWLPVAHAAQRLSAGFYGGFKFQVQRLI